MPPDDAGVPAARAGPTRHLPRWLLLIAAALLVARIGTGIYEHAHPPAAKELVRWRPFDAALAESQRTKKPILYDFTADWCPPCRAMQNEVFADPQAAQQIETLFVPVRVLDRRREEGRNAPEVDTLQARYGVEAFPTLVVVPPDGGEAVILPGYDGRSALLQKLAEAGMRARMGGAFPGQGQTQRMRRVGP